MDIGAFLRLFRSTNDTPKCSFFRKVPHDESRINFFKEKSKKPLTKPKASDIISRYQLNMVT